MRSILVISTVNAEPIHSIEPAQVPDGVYDGEWTGCEVRFTVKGLRYAFSSDAVLWEASSPVRVTINDGSARAEIVDGE